MRRRGGIVFSPFYFANFLTGGLVLVTIKSVIEGSPAFVCGIRAGDSLISLNGHNIKDVLDYMYYAADTDIILRVLRNDEKR